MNKNFQSDEGRVMDKTCMVYVVKASRQKQMHRLKSLFPPSKPGYRSNSHNYMRQVGERVCLEFGVNTETRTPIHAVKGGPCRQARLAGKKGLWSTFLPTSESLYRSS